MSITRIRERIGPAPSSSVHLPKGRYLSILLPKRTPSTPATTPLISPPSMNTARMQTANSPGRGPNGGRGSSSGGEGGGGGRKSNANHLLNFSLPTRAERAPVPRRSRKGGGGEGARWQVFNKEKFVNASFRFMLKATSDYTAYFADSDILFHWPDILQVLVPTPTPSLVHDADEDRPTARSREPTLPSCPICLGVPVAPRMTKCGHVYCFSCVLHYLALSEEKFARCPICTDTIYSRDLKCVTWAPTVPEPVVPAAPAPAPVDHAPIPHNDHDHADIPSDFEDIPSAPSVTRKPVSQPSYPTHILRLVQRPQHTTLALPRSSTWPSAAVLPHEAPFQFLPDVSTYARFMLATPSYLVGELERDIRQLDAEKREQKSAGEDGVGLGFIDAARQKVVDQIGKARAELETAVVTRKMAEVEALLDSCLKRSELEKEREDRSKALLQAAEEEAARRPPPPSTDTLASLGPPVAPTPHALLNHLGHSWSLSSPPPPFVPASSQTSATPSAPTYPNPSTSPTKSSLLNPNASTSRLPGSNQRKPHLAPPPEPSFFFYMSYTGQQIYLHPLDIRVLLHEYKAYSSFPSVLKVGVEGAEEGTMNDDLRRRCKYLAHLPTGCSILFLQIDLAALMSPQTLAAFDAPLKQRRQRRRERGKREERDKRRADAAEREKEGGGLDRRRASAMDEISWGGGGGAGGGGDEFEEALERSLRESQGFDEPGGSVSSSFPPHPHLSTSPPPPSTLNGSPPAWGARSFATALHNTSTSTYGRSTRNAAEEEEVAALWRKFDAQEGAGNRGERDGGGASSAGGSNGTGGGATAGGGGAKKKKKGQKVLLTGGGRMG